MKENLYARWIVLIVVFALIPFVTIATINFAYQSQIDYNFRNWLVGVLLIVLQSSIKKFFAAKR
jgi:hypothetical protein